MLFLLLSIFYQAFAHYFDWRHLFKNKPPQSIFLLLNYSIGCLGIAMAYLAWLTIVIEIPELSNWLLLSGLDSRLMFVVILATNGLTVILCYILDAFVLSQNRIKDAADEISLLKQQLRSIEERHHAQTERA